MLARPLVTPLASGPFVLNTIIFATYFLLKWATFCM
jgi:hypothetical protein